MKQQKPKLTIQLTPDFLQQFKAEAYKRKGIYHGALKDAVTEALQEWIHKKPAQ